MINRQIIASMVVLWLLFSVLDFFVIPHGGNPGAAATPLWSKIPGFYALLGSLGCAVLLGLSKFLGKQLQRDEGYYND